MKKLFTRCSVASFLVLAVFMSSASASIIISQYYEGSSFNKYIELHNAGSSAVDLDADEYNLSHWSNAAREDWKTGGSPTDTQALSGVIPAGGTYLVAHTQASDPSYALPADASGLGGVNFNGDDSSVLWTGTTYSFASVVDAFGVTGSGFSNTSFVRNADVLSGTNADFNASQWTEFSNSDVDNALAGTNQRLGEHAVIPEPSSFVGMLLLFGMAGVTMRRR